MDRYSHWRECLRTGELAATDEPQDGFWRRTLRRGGRYVPVAIFLRDGEQVCVADDRKRQIHHVWSPFMQAITEDAYRQARRDGRFPDELIGRDGSLTTELRECVALSPIVKERPHGRDDTASG